MIVGMPPWMFITIALTLVLAIAVWVPLALRLSQPAQRDPHRTAVPSWMWNTLRLCTLIGALSFVLPTGPMAGLAAGCWLICTIFIGALGTARLFYYGFVRCEEVMLACAMIFLPVGGIWLLASRLGCLFLGFKEPLVALTAVHFHYTALATTIGVGLIGRLIADGERIKRVIYRGLCIGIITAVPLVAIGINGHPILERLGVAVLSLSLIAFAGILLTLTGNGKMARTPRYLLVLAALSIVTSMSLTVLYGFKLFDIQISQMLVSHGVLNAFVFVPSLLLSLRILRPPSKMAVLGRPFSRLRSQGKVGPAFFKNISAVPDGVVAPAGLIDDLRQFERPDLHVERIDPQIRAFYEHTQEHNLDVEAKWCPPFGSIWKWLVEPCFASWGQLTLPSHDMRIESEIVAVQSPLDSRTKVRGWIRVNAATGNAIYVAAYSQHQYNGETYMNIAFPLPFCNLTSILRFDQVVRANDPDGFSDISLTTLARPDFAGDEGVYIVFPAGAWRIPMDETIAVYGGDKLGARHDMWFCSLLFLTLQYHITGAAPD